jgi:hypothetical protein
MLYAVDRLQGRRRRAARAARCPLPLPAARCPLPAARGAAAAPRAAPSSPESDSTRVTRAVCGRGGEGEEGAACGECVRAAAAHHHAATMRAHARMPHVHAPPRPVRTEEGKGKPPWPMRPAW